MHDAEEMLRKLGRELGLPPEALAQIEGVVAAHTTRAARTVTLGGPEARAASGAGLLDPAASWPWERYEDLGLLGRGGMGEVRRVRDRLLGREVAMKLLSPEIGATAEARERFLTEARLTARLQHPGLVPVHDCGALPSGLLWFTMKLVRGRTLSAVIQALHAGREDGPPPEARSRVIDAYARVCEAVAYAHAEGVLHRDLKPDNVMLGELGEALVLDWGIARGLARPGQRGTGGLARRGRVWGTPAYMAPEQTLGDPDQSGPASDVYALGAVLYSILCGEAPYSGTPEAIFAQLAHSPPAPLTKRVRGSIPADLIAICERSMARRPEDRPRDALALAEEIRAFLDGALRRERARARVLEARAMTPRIDALRARARRLHVDARAVLSRVEAFDADEDKAHGWALEDEARALDRAAALEMLAFQQSVHAALLEAPDLHEAHDALAEVHLAELLAAERARDGEAAARAEALLRAHARGRHEALLRGDGALTLVTAPDGAEVRLFRYVERRRRLCAEPAGSLGRTPLRAVTLQRGSYLLLIRAPGCCEARYPLNVDRGAHHDGVRPGGAAPFVLPLPREDALGDDDVYVPAGWFLSGGDPQASESLSPRRRWVDGFVAKRHPVTQAEYLEFLNDLVATGREAEAEAACPRAGRAVSGTVNVPLFVRGPDRRFKPGPHMPPEPSRHPVASVSWHDAMTYAAWYAARTGQPWRLPGEEEREKAARGVDGRFFPWGDQPETTWACMVSSRPGPASPAPVDAYATDESPYGIRGLAGNVRDWCAEVWTPEGPAPEGEIARVRPAGVEEPGLRAIRGGSFSSAPPAMCRAAGRFAARPDERFSAVGLRLVRSLGGAGEGEGMSR